MSDVQRELRQSSGGLLAYGGVDLELRAADADRDRAAAVLGGALATGRLTSAEHAERLDAVYAAKTMGDLAPLTRDLPAEDGAVVVPSGAHVIDEGGALFAKRAIYGRKNDGDADGPVIRIVGDARFSKVAVHRGRLDRHEGWAQWMQQW